MKSILVWVLILQFASGHNLLAEIVRMPSLLDHFQIHREETPDLSFGRFLWMHYLENSHTHSDNSHAQLPLHCSHGWTADSETPKTLALELYFIVPASERSGLPVFEEKCAPGDYSFGLFRPPLA